MRCCSKMLPKYSMIKSRPHLIFWMGLLITVVVTSLLYLFLPRYDYYSGAYSIYKPQNALPETHHFHQTVSNIYLLLRFTKYAIIYWLTFGSLYLIAGKINKIKISQYYIWVHAVCTFFGFSLLIYFNRFIVSPKSQSQYLSDIFIGKEVTESQTLAMNQLMLWYDSINIATSLIGILFCVIGVLVFFVGLIRGMSTRVNHKPG
jgi:hypothetical protein